MRQIFRDLLLDTKSGLQSYCWAKCLLKPLLQNDRP